MFLEKLVVKSNKGIIREIKFKRGLNLVIDESTTDVQTESGNSVGKTTFLRVIDYCFGSNGNDIYTDNEFKTINENIHNFLTEKEVTFELTLKNKNKYITLQRGFPANAVLQINEQEYPTITDYKVKLGSLFFKITSGKPSIRQLMPKFIRKDNNTMSNTLFFLHNSTGKNDYEVLFLYLFGFLDHSLLVERLQTSHKLKKITKRITVLKQGRSVSASKQILKLTERDIQKLEKQIQTFDVSDQYKKEIDELTSLKREISNLTVEINNLRLRLSLNQETLNELKNNKSDIDPKTIRELYNEAEKLIPSIQKKFEDVLNFHNQMVDKKVEFVEQQLIATEKKANKLEIQLTSLLKNESKILRTLSDMGSFENLAILQKEINQLYEKKGKQNQFISLIEEETNTQKELKDVLEQLNKKVQRHLKDFEEKITAFNFYFSDYSKKLYDEKYILTQDVSDTGTVTFEIDNVQGNVGSGKKKAQISAFDLAYISLQNELNSDFPRFVFHDSIEDVHKNQIKTLFEISNTIDGQYIVSILRDKISFLGDEYLTYHKILSLSQEEMFFKTPK